MFQLETCTITFDYREKRLLARFDTENERITQRLASARLVTTTLEKISERNFAEQIG